MKNITLSADEKLIEAARQQAAANGTTLNNEFREWLASKVLSPKQRAARFKQLIEQTSYAKAGRKFSRQEMNER